MTWGWQHIVDEALEKIKSIEPNFEVFQIKEKFGELRIYGGPGNEEVWKIIDDATTQSLKTCEVCGKPGKLRTDHGWWKTVCDEHR